MELLNDSFDYEQFKKTIAGAPKRALLLDFDGTLAPFVEERDQARIHPDVQPVLNDILRQGKVKVAIISGRSVADLKQLVTLDVMPELWGSHGLERLMSDGSYHCDPPSDAVFKGMTRIKAWIDEQGMADDTEVKPSGIAFHWRGKSESEARQMEELIRDTWEAKLDEFELAARPFDGGIEFRVDTHTKADAVKRIRRDYGSSAWMAYLGDDLTDEDAFEALNGNKIAVLVRPEKRESAADIWIKPPDELVAFLTLFR